MVDNPDLERLEDYRKGIDNLDSALIAILAERFRQTDKIGETKAALGFDPTDPKRECSQLEQFGKLASSHNLDVAVALDIMSRIIQHAKDRYPPFNA